MPDSIPGCIPAASQTACQQHPSRASQHYCIKDLEKTKKMWAETEANFVSLSKKKEDLEKDSLQVASQKVDLERQLTTERINANWAIKEKEDELSLLKGFLAGKGLPATREAIMEYSTRDPSSSSGVESAAAPQVAPSSIPAASQAHPSSIPAAPSSMPAASQQHLIACAAGCGARGRRACVGQRLGLVQRWLAEDVGSAHPAGVQRWAG